jgi:16S rRNA (guanine966-N2)-methyltransferase
MRVIAGSARGIELKHPRGETRPTSSRLRESLFGMLEAADVDWTRVVDLYAGSGALGIEALSRGAEHCTFVESNRRACAVIRDNLRLTKLEDASTVVARPVERWRAPAEPVTLVLADPPYDDDDAWHSIEEAIDATLTERATIVVEHSARVTAPPTLAGRPLWRDRRQGDGAVAIYRAEEDA